MSGQNLTEEQKKAIKDIKKKWLDEADEYLKRPASGTSVLDGEASSALAAIQKKYKLEIQKILSTI